MICAIFHPTEEREEDGGRYQKQALAKNEAKSCMARDVLQMNGEERPGEEMFQLTMEGFARSSKGRSSPVPPRRARTKTSLLASAAVPSSRSSFADPVFCVCEVGKCRRHLCKFMAKHLSHPKDLAAPTVWR